MKKTKRKPTPYFEVSVRESGVGLYGTQKQPTEATYLTASFRKALKKVEEGITGKLHFDAAYVRIYYCTHKEVGIEKSVILTAWKKLQ